MARVLFFVNVKAVLNTIMVYTGWKRPGAFKVTTKAGGAPTPAGGGDAPVEAPKPPEPEKVEEVERDTGGPTIPKVLKGLKMHRLQDSLSKITEKRKTCMPFEGTFDFWVLLGITLMNLAAVGIGFYRINNKEALHPERYIFVEAKAEWVMKIWVPLLIGTVSVLCILIEFRVGIQYIGQNAGEFVDYAPEDTVCGNLENPANRS